MNQKKLSTQREGRCSGLKVHPYSCTDEIKTFYHRTHPTDPKVANKHSFHNMGTHESPSKTKIDKEKCQKKKVIDYSIRTVS